MININYVAVTLLNPSVKCPVCPLGHLPDPNQAVFQLGQGFTEAITWSIGKSSKYRIYSATN